MIRLVVHQGRYELIKFWRDPQAVFFTVALPVVFLVIFAAVFGNETLDDRSGLKVSTYYVPGIIALGVMAAAFVSLAIGLVEQRERGILKRLRATPLPPGAFIAARAGIAMLLTALIAVVLTLIGWVLYGVTIPSGRAPGLLLTLAVGTAAFGCLGFALSSPPTTRDRTVRPAHRRSAGSGPPRARAAARCAARRSARHRGGRRGSVP